jgi:hypothetical protein
MTLYDDREIVVPALRPRATGPWRYIDPVDEPMPSGVILPGDGTDLARRTHTVAWGGYQVERIDKAQPLRTFVPDETKALAAAVLLWCRVSLAALGTVLAGVIGVVGVIRWGPW